MDKSVESYKIDLKRSCANRKSKVWDYFGTLNIEGESVEEDKVFCKICLEKQKKEYGTVIFSCAKIQSYSKNCSTGNLTRHLKNEHNIRDVDPENNSLTPISKFFNKCAPPKSSKDRKWILGRDLALWMARDLLPFHVISHNGIKDFLKKYKVAVADDDIPHYKTLSTTALDDVYEAVLKLVTREIYGQRHFALTFDLWTDNFRRRNYITFTFHSLTSFFEMKHLTLETKYISKSHTANNILAELQEVTDKFNLRLASNFVVTDQGSNIKKAISLGCIKNHFCLGHGLHNLLSVDGYNSVPELRNLIIKCKSIVRALRFKTHILRCQADAIQNEILSSIDNLEELLASEDDSWMDYEDGFGPLDDVSLETYRHINNINDLHGSLVGKRNITLKNAVVTRWHSVLSMLDSLGSQRTAINKLLTQCNKTDLILLETEAQLVYKLRDFLQKFKDSVNILSGDSYPSISLALIIRTEIVSILEANDGSDLSGNNLRSSDFCPIDQMKNNMKSRLDYRFPMSDILVCASLLDPRFSSLNCISKYCTAQNLTNMQFLIKMYRRLIGDVQINSDNQNASDNTPSTSKIMKLAERHSSHSKDMSLEAECHLLLSLSSTQNVLSFWREKSCSMPLLSILAQKVLCIPATSTPSERVFSIAGLTITNKRSQLSPHNVNKIIFIHDNYDSCKENLLL